MELPESRMVRDFRVHRRPRGSRGHAGLEGCVMVGVRDMRVRWGHGGHKGQNILGSLSSRGSGSREIQRV